MSAVEFLGQVFEVPEKINERRLLRLAKHANAGEDSAGMAGMAALDELLDQCVRAEDTARFDALCDEHGASIAQLFEFTAKVIGAVAQRPTERPSVSSGGPKATPENSGTRLEQLATEKYPGRPDLYLAATAQERDPEASSVAAAAV